MADMQNKGETMLEVTGVKKSFAGLEVLKGIDLTVKRGEVLAIIGPSGSGKSTLLRCLNKLETIDSGTILVEGKPLVKTGADGKAEYVDSAAEKEVLSHMGMVFQQFNLFPHMTVIENLIEAPVQVQGQKKSEILPYARELLEKVADDLSRKWEGIASNSYFGRFNVKQDTLATVINGMQDVVNYEHKAVQIYRDANRIVNGLIDEMF